MEDIIVKYQKQKRIKNISIVITSLCLALALNILISTNNINLNSMLKWSVIESSSFSNKADLFIEKNEKSAENILSIKPSKEMKNVKNISFSLAYNYENVKIDNKFSNLEWAEVLNLSNTNWFNTILINFKNPTTINPNSSILNVVLTKSEQKEENLNIITSNFTDEKEKIFMLSSTWIEF